MDCFRKLRVWYKNKFSRDFVYTYYAYGVEITIDLNGNGIVKLNDFTSLIYINDYSSIIHNGDYIETDEVHLLYHSGKYYNMEMEEIPAKYGLFSRLNYNGIIYGNEAYHAVYQYKEGIHLLNYSTNKFLWGRLLFIENCGKLPSNNNSVFIDFETSSFIPSKFYTTRVENIELKFDCNECGMFDNGCKNYYLIDGIKYKEKRSMEYLFNNNYLMVNSLLVYLCDESLVMVFSDTRGVKFMPAELYRINTRTKPAIRCLNLS